MSDNDTTRPGGVQRLRAIEGGASPKARTARSRYDALLTSAVNDEGPDQDDLYVIACDEMGAFKVGRSSSVAARLSQLQTANPFKLRLVCVLRGWGSLEAEVHASLPNRLHGEWFGRSPRLQALMSGAAAVPPGAAMLSCADCGSARISLLATAGPPGWVAGEDLDMFPSTRSAHLLVSCEDCWGAREIVAVTSGGRSYLYDSAGAGDQ